MDRSAVEALVQVGAVVTQYRRAGRGEVVLLIAAGDSPAARLFDRLAERHRVVQPQLPESCSAEWLPQLVEALGLDRPMVVAESRLAAPLRAMVAADCGRFGPLLFVDDAGMLDDPIDALGLEPPVSSP